MKTPNQWIVNETIGNVTIQHWKLPSNLYYNYEFRWLRTYWLKRHDTREYHFPYKRKYSKPITNKYMCKMYLRMCKDTRKKLMNKEC